VDALREQAGGRLRGGVETHVERSPEEAGLRGPNAAAQKSASARWIVMIEAIGFGDLKQAAADSNSKESSRVKCRIVSVARTSDQRRYTLSIVGANQWSQSALADRLQPRDKSQAIQRLGHLPLRLPASQGSANACSVASTSAATLR
jgi:hypothetical protein